MQVKGKALRSILAATEEEGGASAAPEVLAGVPPGPRAEVACKPPATQYDSASPHAALQTALRVVLGRGDLAANRRMGERAARIDCSGVDSVFLSLSGPRATPRRMERTWPNHGSYGQLEAEFPESTRAPLRVVGADGYREDVWHAVLGRAFCVLALAGARGVEAELWTPICRGRADVLNAAIRGDRGPVRTDAALPRRRVATTCGGDMPTFAVLDDVLPMQLRERPDELAPMQLVWSGVDLERLRAELPRLRPDVLLLDLQRLGADPLAEARALVQSCGAQLLILLYDFAPRDTLREAARMGARPVKVPVRLGALRAQMTGVIVRSILGGEEATTGEAATAPPPASHGWGDIAAHAAAESVAGPAKKADLPPRRYSRAQLGRLAEIQSSIDCECPNHLSELLLGLTAFEDYSARCENRNAADAAVHAALHRATAQARAIMEEALSKLLVHEKIVL
jgi:hypothetical protein